MYAHVIQQGIQGRDRVVGEGMRYKIFNSSAIMLFIDATISDSHGLRHFDGLGGGSGGI